MPPKKYTYVIVLECPSSGDLKGKIGHTDDLLKRLRQLEYENSMNLISKKSIYYCADIESDLLAATVKYAIDSERSEYRTIKGIESARRKAKRLGHQSQRLTSFFKAQRDRQTAEQTKEYYQNLQKEKVEESANLNWRQERIKLLEAQTQWLPHPDRSVWNMYDWKPTGTNKVSEMQVSNPRLISRLFRLRHLACEITKKIVSPQIALYLKPCPLDDSDLFRNYQIVYGWMPYDQGYYYGDLAITKALILYSTYWEYGDSPYKNQTTLICRDFKRFDHLRSIQTLRLSRIVRECIRVQDELFNLRL